MNCELLNCCVRIIVKCCVRKIVCVHCEKSTIEDAKEPYKIRKRNLEDTQKSHLKDAIEPYVVCVSLFVCTV